MGKANLAVFSILEERTVFLYGTSDAPRILSRERRRTGCWRFGFKLPFDLFFTSAFFPVSYISVADTSMKLIAHRPKSTEGNSGRTPIAAFVHQGYHRSTAL